MSHGILFFLYALLIGLTIRWHENKNLWNAALIGLVIGLAVLCRPTELIMIFIPLFWNTHTKEGRQEKWKFLKENPKHIVFAALTMMAVFVIQLVYWKIVTGSFLYDVGSKWQFLNSWFRVLFGFEKGWFIYTPLTILFIIGLFLSKGWSFRNALLVFGILNIWIIISWHDWRYGGSYSTRALVQSYPIFVLGAGIVVHKLLKMKTKILWIGSITLLIGLNLFQIYQYNSGILLNDGMDFEKYWNIFLQTKA